MDELMPVSKSVQWPCVCVCVCVFVNVRHKTDTQ